MSFRHRLCLRLVQLMVKERTDWLTKKERVWRSRHSGAFFDLEPHSVRNEKLMLPISKKAYTVQGFLKRSD